jgi:hypothetical protein
MNGCLDLDEEEGALWEHRRDASFFVALLS